MSIYPRPCCRNPPVLSQQLNDDGGRQIEHRRLLDWLLRRVTEGERFISYSRTLPVILTAGRLMAARRSFPASFSLAAGRLVMIPRKIDGRYGVYCVKLRPGIERHAVLICQHHWHC